MELSEIKGLKAKRIEKLNSVGIFKPEDLVMRFPYKYIDKNAEIDFDKFSSGDEIAFIGKVVSDPVRKFVKKGLSFVKVKTEIQGKEITCTWFNQPFLYKVLIKDNFYVLCGKIKKFRSSLELTSPSVKTYDDDGKDIIPLYKSIKGLPHNILLDAIDTTLKSMNITGIFDDIITKKYSLLIFDKAVKALHFPKSINDAEIASYSAALEKLCANICEYSLLKKLNGNKKTYQYDVKHLQKIHDFIKTLPYELTCDQKSALKTIFESLNSNTRMNKLVQGDVGCGKTIVAFVAMYYSALNGYQSAFMAPTELLAKQHYINAVNLFENTGINIEFLSGSLNKTAKDTALFNIKNRVADIVIGTHSIISENVEFSDLALIITDEQQRFGVSQRGALENKTVGADSIVMSATPIPRTLALSFYGDLDQVLIKEMPQKKAKISTHFVSENKIAGMMDYLKKCADDGLQTYIVCPRIDNEDEDSEIESVKELYSKYSAHFGNKNCALLHGQMKDAEKNEIMRKFLKAEIKLLFATTIIEVGIDVPNAVNIVIFNAERYGLSQLHQLRGRVGRGTTDSYCFVLTQSDDPETLKRIEYFIKVSDGFELAEYDLSVRGAGDFLGERQHGGAGFNTIISIDMLKKAKEISEYLLNIPEFVNGLNEKLDSGRAENLYNLTIN